MQPLDPTLQLQRVFKCSASRVGNTRNCSNSPSQGDDSNPLLHEEVVADLVRSEIRSYRQLPALSGRQA